WIISGVNVVDARGPGELDLYDHLLVPGPGEVRMLCRYHIQGARFEHLAFRFIELFAHAEADATADDSDNLCIVSAMAGPVNLRSFRCGPATARTTGAKDVSGRLSGSSAAKARRADRSSART